MAIDPLASFKSFRDAEGSPFYQACGLSPEQTWREIHVSLVNSSAGLGARYEAGEDVTPTAANVVAWHHEVFVSTFPRDAGRIRSKDSLGWEHVSFGIDIGTERTRSFRPLTGSHPSRIEPRVAKACDGFRGFREDARANPRSFSLRDVTYEVARLYAKLLSTHPFVDGNLRGATIALQAALLSLDLALFNFADYDLHQAAISRALRTDGRQSYRQLGDLMAGIIESAV
jgi:fido (protein-threonine AMPylation protein)